MARAAVVQQSGAQFAGFMPVFHHVKAEQGRELFLGERILVANALFVRNEQARTLGHVDAGDACNGQGVAAHNGGVHAAIAAFHDVLDLFQLFALEEVGSLGFQRGAHLGGDAGFGDNGLLGGADGAVVESFAAHDLGHGAFDIGGAFNEGGRVASAHAQCGRAGAVRGLDHAGAARGKDEIADLHQFVGAFDGGNGDAAHQIGRHVAAAQRALNDFHRLGNALAGAGVRRKHNGVA